MTSSPEGRQEAAVAWREFDHETIDYVLRYGGRCRECADHLGLCPNGLPCDVDDAKTAIRWVLKALNYGIANGFVMQPPAGETIRTTQDGSMGAAPETGQSPVGAVSTPCGLPSPSASDCTNMKEYGGGMDGERYHCDVCDKGYFLDYEDMK